MNKEENSVFFDKKKKVSLHLLVDPDMKDEIIKYAQEKDFDNVSQAGREILKKGLKQIKSDK
ncbi:regulator [Staphylococcus arlettae]|uniref:ArtA n=2 Tax=Staphylococcus TaxID=1279 RepID=A0A7G3T383_9STAP|nr:MULTISPECIES: regulator [Staphylococcus]MDW4130268.1 regulator [Staphylococcus saprophyticus]QJR98781.1 ArtA [Staphylococcus equorum]AJW29108.1 putative regulator of transfer genes ArtA [Staphylococcus epidermidis]AKJ75114.1 putative transfer gene regulator [Staphylococcus epidermidis]MDO6380723.1 regulator [Staphylococcus epidermidis]